MKAILELHAGLKKAERSFKCAQWDLASRPSCMLDRCQVWRVLNAPASGGGSASCVCFYSAQRETWDQHHILQIKLLITRRYLKIAAMKAGQMAHEQRSAWSIISCSRVTLQNIDADKKYVTRKTMKPDKGATVTAEKKSQRAG